MDNHGSSYFIYQIQDEPVELTISKEGIAKFRTNGQEPVYVDLQTGNFTNISGNEIFDTVPILFLSWESVGKTIKD